MKTKKYLLSENLAVKKWDLPSVDLSIIPYKETLNTDKKLMLDLLKGSIKQVDNMAANMFDPVEYSTFTKLMRTLIKRYK